MTFAIMNIPKFIATLVATASLAFTVSACTPGTPAGGEPPLAGARIGGAFTLTNQDGQSVTDKTYDGKYRLIYFGYTFCPDVCPVDLKWLMLGLKKFEEQDAGRAARVQPIFVTVDPARDTPAVIKPWIANFHPRLVGLTGTQEQIDAINRAYLVTARKVEGSTPDSYLMAHTQLAYLMDPQGKPVALIPLDQIATENVNEGDPALVAAELARWVR